MKYSPEEVSAAVVVGQNEREVEATKRFNAQYDRQWEPSLVEEPMWGEIDGVLPTPIGDIKLIEDVGGEGQGDHAHVVVQVVATGQFFKITGYYSSYEGTDWDGELKEVQAVERLVTFYE